jgi:hypothetical protein
LYFITIFNIIYLFFFFVQLFFILQFILDSRNRYFQFYLYILISKMATSREFLEALNTYNSCPCVCLSLSVLHDVPFKERKRLM